MSFAAWFELAIRLVNDFMASLGSFNDFVNIRIALPFGEYPLIDVIVGRPLWTYLSMSVQSAAGWLSGLASIVDFTNDGWKAFFEDVLIEFLEFVQALIPG